jgi:hypothetical protein
MAFTTCNYSSGSCLAQFALVALPTSFPLRQQQVLATRSEPHKTLKILILVHIDMVLTVCVNSQIGSTTPNSDVNG